MENWWRWSQVLLRWWSPHRSGVEWGEGGLAGAWMALAEKRRGIMKVRVILN